ncbi:hypothetical protein D3C72_704500 [compost metagenome]
MNQTQEVLFVEVFQVAVVVLRSQVLGEFVVTTGVDELVAIDGAWGSTVDRHLFIVAGVAALDVLDLATRQSQVLDLAGSDLTAFPGLRQQATVVGHDDRQFRLQGTQLQLSLGNLGLGGQAQAGEVINCFAIGFAWENSTAVSSGVRCTVGTTARIQLHAQQADRIDTEADSALGVTGDKTQIEALAPFFVFVRDVAGAITEVLVDVEVAQPQSSLAVFDETGGACLLRQNPYGHSQGQGGLVHLFRSYRFLILVLLVLGRMPWIHRRAIRAGPSEAVIFRARRIPLHNPKKNHQDCFNRIGK